MIEYVKGKIDRVSPTDVVIDVNGVGYGLSISLTTFSKIEKATEAKLLVHEVIREDAHDLFGFAEEQERAMFRLLIGVSGVGPNTARMILSSLMPQQLQMAITADDHTKLKAVKGIGLKTAQRIIVDLKDKIATAELTALAEAQGAGSAAAVDKETYEEALAALVMLGFTRPQSQKALAKIFESNPNATAEAAIKRALTMM
jgi:Holliday junction DNA helicase RuvA